MARYTCNCQTCYDTKPFTSCSKAVTYGIARLHPAAGAEAGGTPVLITSTTSFQSSTKLNCRFGTVVVPAAFVSPTTLQCVSPAFNPTSGKTAKDRSVPVEVSLDGENWTHDNTQFRYCGPKEFCPNCDSGWKGKNCSVECQGGAIHPCNGRGICLDEPAGECTCHEGFTGRACEYDTATTKSWPKGGEGKGRAKMQGIVLGLSISISVLLVLCLVGYVKRSEVLEYVFWTLAATRFQRLHQHDHPTGDIDDSSDSIASPGPPPLGPPPVGMRRNSWGSITSTTRPWGRVQDHDDEEDEEWLSRLSIGLCVRWESSR